MITLTQCCCGCRLQTGALILGWLGVLGSLLGIIALSVGLAHMDDLLEVHVKSPDADPDQVNFIQKVATIVLSVVLAFYIISCVASACLIFGTIQKRHSFLLPWLVIAAIGIGLGCLSVVGMFIAGIINDAPYAILGRRLTLLGVNILLQMYFFLVVYSLYKQMRDENSTPKNVVSLQPAEPLMPPPYPSYNKT